jgi:hypothetical protein
MMGPGMMGPGMVPPYGMRGPYMYHYGPGGSGTHNIDPSKQELRELCANAKPKLSIFQRIRKWWRDFVATLD